jgi:Alpha and gamma adaptin binding protein p34
VDRLREALEANEWEGNNDGDGEIDLDELEAGDEGAEDDGSVGFGIDPAEMQEDMAGMKQAIYEGGAGSDDEIEDEETGDKEIQQLQAMMLKMQAVRGKSLQKMLKSVLG